MEIRYLVPPRQPPGSEQLNVRQLAARDSMIGVALALADLVEQLHDRAENVHRP